MRAAKHQMIDDPAVQRLGSAGEAAGGATVALARPGIAARMIVSEQDSGGAVVCRVGDDRPEREVGPIFVADMIGEVKTIMRFIEVGDPQPLDIRVGLRQAAGEEFAGGGESVELEREFGTLISHGAEVEDGRGGDDWKRV